MSDYSHIPIHLRITERWKIDSEYDAEKYHKTERLIERFKGGGAHSRRNVPGIVLKYLCEIVGTTQGAQSPVLAEAAAEMQMLPEDLYNVMKHYRRTEVAGIM